MSTPLPTPTSAAGRPSPLLRIQEPATAAALPAPGGWPLFRLGFRPFYLLCCAGAALLPELWVAALMGLLPLQPALPAPLWHGHEMVFGVVIAAVVGFLFTAGRLWTGLATPTGLHLAAFAALWLAARVAALTGPYALFLWLDAAFLPLAAAVFFDLVARSKNWRNLPMAALLALLAAGNLLFHAAHLQLIALTPSQVLQLAVLLLVAVVSIVAGRVIPAFIGSAVPGSSPRSHAAIERSVLPLTAVVIALWALAPAGSFTAVAFLSLAMLHALRLLLWKPWRSRGRPILWVLPLAYAWLPVGLALWAAAGAGGWPVSMGLHALTAGAMGMLIVGMISRTSRGHTGQPLQAGRAEVWAYRLVGAGALLRVLAGGATVAGVAGAVHWGLLAAGAALWSGAFALLLVALAPWWLVPRLDGKAG
jgi:uncharacterized protein involved in response to NO